MSSKTLIWGGMTLGSTIGSMVPALWGDFSLFSFTSMISTLIGGAAGIWLGIRISRYMEGL